MRVARPGLLLLVLVLVSSAGCATRGTIRDLGHPEFEKDVPEGQKLTLVEPVQDGERDYFASGSNETADHSSVVTDEVPAHVEGENLVMSFVAASKNKAIKVELVQVLVYPVGPKDVIPFRMQGTLPDRDHPVATFFNEKKYVPGTSALRVDVTVPLAKIGSADQLAVPTLLRFEDGWVTIVFRAAPVPKG